MSILRDERPAGNFDFPAYLRAKAKECTLANGLADVWLAAWLCGVASRIERGEFPDVPGPASDEDHGFACVRPGRN